MEEIEGLTESSEEHIHEAAHGEHGGGARWTSWVALSTAIISTLAAITALLSGSNANEAMLHQLEASDQWAYYQAKGVKAAITEARNDVWMAAGKPADPKLQEKLDRYKEEQKEITEKATGLQNERTAELRCHETYAKGVTFFQVAISIAAISVLTRRRRYFAVSGGFALIGVVFFFLALWSQFGPHAEKAEAPAAEQAAK